ncbi:CRISPR-associated protein Csn2-St [Vagococcus elongatus]|uniref:Uncharacterized protein n=1 Tax=Vagococcus elongatus TaxID=180344 RepID=A0A430B207_9ENTE|nr:CRISPR-associated protein Csn2-St [Vagococcus elongatus]RSU14329.1 hypothetical protein CBF29_03245 [Vagococcus elongatus]
MAEFRIEYENGKFITLDLQDYLFFYGGQNAWKRKIIRTLKRFSYAKSLSELEETVYGENGIEIYYDGKLLNAKNMTVYFLEDNTSVFSQLAFLKDTLMYEELESLQNNFEVGKQMELINEDILHLETIISKRVGCYSNNIACTLSPLNFIDLLKRHLILKYIDDNMDYPLSMMNSSELLDEFIYLIKAKIKREERMTWIVLANPERFLERKDISYLFGQLHDIATETKQLKFFILNNSSLVLDYTTEDIDKTVLLFDDYQQLPSFEIFRESIERNYPDKFSLDECQLVSSFYRVCNFIGESRHDIYINPKDMVLLRVMKELLMDESRIETSFQPLTQLEKQFLKDW